MSKGLSCPTRPSPPTHSPLTSSLAPLLPAVPPTTCAYPLLAAHQPPPAPSQACREPDTPLSPFRAGDDSPYPRLLLLRAGRAQPLPPPHTATALVAAAAAILPPLPTVCSVKSLTQLTGTHAGALWSRFHNSLPQAEEQTSSAPPLPALPTPPQLERLPSSLLRDAHPPFSSPTPPLFRHEASSCRHELLPHLPVGARRDPPSGISGMADDALSISSPSPPSPRNVVEPSPPTPTVFQASPSPPPTSSHTSSLAFASPAPPMQPDIESPKLELLRIVAPRRASAGPSGALFSIAPRARPPHCWPAAAGWGCSRACLFRVRPFWSPARRAGRRRTTTPPGRGNGMEIPPGGRPGRWHGQKPRRLRRLFHPTRRGSARHLF